MNNKTAVVITEIDDIGKCISKIIALDKYGKEIHSNEIQWEYNFGALDNLGEFNYESLVNINTYIENDEVVIKGFLDKVNDDSSKEDFYKLHMKINTKGELESLL